MLEVAKEISAILERQESEVTRMRHELDQVWLELDNPQNSVFDRKRDLLV